MVMIESATIVQNLPSFSILIIGGVEPYEPLYVVRRRELTVIVRSLLLMPVNVLPFSRYIVPVLQCVTIAKPCAIVLIGAISVPSLLSSPCLSDINTQHTSENGEAVSHNSYVAERSVSVYIQMGKGSAVIIPDKVLVACPSIIQLSSGLNAP